jgi:hypothetical protein
MIRRIAVVAVVAVLLGLALGMSVAQSIEDARGVTFA